MHLGQLTVEIGNGLEKSSLIPWARHVQSEGGLDEGLVREGLERDANDDSVAPTALEAVS